MFDRSDDEKNSTVLKILSFDIEDWFHILDNASTRMERDWSYFPARIDRNVERVLEALSRAGKRATFFCLGWMARAHPSVVRRIASQGHEIACHSDMHQLVYELGPQKFRSDLKNAISSLEDVLGYEIVTYRAPGFSVTINEAAWFFEALGEQGIQVDCSVFAGRHGHGGLPAFPATPCKVRWSGGVIKEFPMGYATILGQRIVYSGGGYFRLAPYPLIRYCATRASYVMTYFHPRDFDPDQPVVPGLSAIRRFKSYYGLKSALSKLERFMSDFPFQELRSAVTTIKWEETAEFKFSK